MGLIHQESKANRNTSVLPADDVSEVMYDVSKRKMKQRILVTEYNDPQFLEGR